MKEVCNGKINTSGICERCYEVSQATPGYCSRLIEAQPVTAKTEQSQDEQVNEAFRHLGMGVTVEDQMLDFYYKHAIVEMGANNRPEFKDYNDEETDLNFMNGLL